MKKNFIFTLMIGKWGVQIPLDSKEIKPVNPKGNQPWIFIGGTDAEAEAPVLRPTDSKIWLIEKDLDAGKDWGWEEKGVTENEMVGWHHQLNGHEFEQTLGDSDGQGSLACCNPWDCRVRHDFVTKQQQQQQIILTKDSLTEQKSHRIYACKIDVCGTTQW